MRNPRLVHITFSHRTATLLQASQLAAGVANREDIRRAESPFKVPPKNRLQSPPPTREASVHGTGLESFVVKDGQTGPFGQETSRSFSHQANELFAPPPQASSQPIVTKDVPADSPRPKLPTVCTSREDWMDRNQSPLSFGQSEVSFTPENVLARDDFAFDRDFDGFDSIRMKQTIDGFHSPKSEIVVQARAESFDWDTDFHRAASPFKSRPTPEPQTSTQASVSLDDGLISSIRTATSRTTPKDSFEPPAPKGQDPSPMSMQQQRSTIPKVARGGSTATPSQSGPQKTPPKAVPTNAILGSMLFRQTQTSNTPESKRRKDRAGASSSSFIGESRSKDAAATPSSSSFICENRSRGTGSTSMFSRHQQSSFIVANRSKSDDAVEQSPSRGGGALVSSSKHATTGYSRSKATTLDKIPSAVAASDGSESNVSSVTEEASSFYKKSFGGGRSPHSWNEPAQKLLNNYNVRKNHLRTTNTTSFSGGGRDQTPSSKIQHQQRSNGEPLSRSEAEHINVFLSEV